MTPKQRKEAAMLKQQAIVNAAKADGNRALTAEERDRRRPGRDRRPGKRACRRRRSAVSAPGSITPGKHRPDGYSGSRGAPGRPEGSRGRAYPRSGDYGALQRF